MYGMSLQGSEMRPQVHLGKTDDASGEAKTVANDLSEVIDDKSETIRVFRLNGEPSEERVSNVTWNSDQSVGFQFDLDQRHMRVYTRCEGDPSLYQVVLVQNEDAINHYLSQITGGTPFNQPNHIKTAYTAITGIPVPRILRSTLSEAIDYNEFSHLGTLLSDEGEFMLPEPANPVSITLNHA